MNDYLERKLGFLQQEAVNRLSNEILMVVGQQQTLANKGESLPQGRMISSSVLSIIVEASDNTEQQVPRSPRDQNIADQHQDPNADQRSKSRYAAQLTER